MDFYATLHKGYPLYHLPLSGYWLLPSSSWFDVKSNKFRDAKLPLYASDHFAIDCGGFVAARIWGDYRYTDTEYVNWLNSFSIKPEWAAIMDYCCEDEITTGNQGIVYERQDKTTANVESFWQYRDSEWMWIPTIQGWNIKDYIRHAIELKPLIRQWHDYYRSQGKEYLFRVGIGTLCARPYTADIQAIVMTMAQLLPDVRFHLWGVKLQVLKSIVRLPRIQSVDSAAWNGMIGKDRHKGRNEYTSMNMTKNAYEIKIALPRYLQKIDKALNQPKQMTLFE